MAKPNGPAKMLVLGESWCPDVFRGAPVFARLAEATGIEARFFFRDQNKDIMAEFLKDGEYESIPVAVFYTKDHQYIAHWIERPVLANREMKELLGPMYARMRKPDLTDEEKEAAKAGEHRLPARPGLGELASGDHPRSDAPARREDVVAAAVRSGLRREGCARVAY